MTSNKQKLELTWVGKENRPRLEPRILIEDPEKSHHAPHRVTDHDVFDNRLIFGDNLLALKALEQEFAGKVKCVYIDPPYNTGSAFEHYDDSLEHSVWLGMMRERLVLIRELLATDGSVWVHLDDAEMAYCRVLMDEVFGRQNFVATVVWQKVYARDNRTNISTSHDSILIFAMNGDAWKATRNTLPRTVAQNDLYKNPDDDPRGLWRLGPIFAAEERHEGLMYEITTPSGRKVKPPAGSHWRMVENDFWHMVEEGRITFGDRGSNIPAVKLFLNEVQSGLVPRTWWPHTEAGHTQDAKREIHALFPGQIPFDTPKPEKLVSLAIQIASKPGDIVLDSFLGSGTTAAVAHKMGRRWIGIEEGDHARTYCQIRMKKVIDGEQGGISETVEWHGGGGFRFYKLGPAVFDDTGHIRAGITFELLAAHVWFAETGAARSTRAKKEPFLGEHDGIGYYLLFNGVLGDETKTGGNVLTKRLLRSLPTFEGPKVIYGEACMLTDEQLAELDITFRQTPYDLKAR